MKKEKCERCWFFAKDAIGYIESVWAGTRRYYVCQKHKESEFSQNEIRWFKEPMFAPELKFFPLTSST